MKHNRYFFLDELNSKHFYKLIDCLSLLCERMVLVLSEDLLTLNKTEHFLEKLNSITKVNKYLSKNSYGMIRSDESVYIIEFLINEHSISLIKESFFGLFRLGPFEDLTFLRSDGSPFMITILHEEIGYIDCSVEEYKLMMKLFPNLGLILSENIKEVEFVVVRISNPVHDIVEDLRIIKKFDSEQTAFTFCESLNEIFSDDNGHKYFVKAINPHMY